MAEAVPAARPPGLPVVIKVGGSLSESGRLKEIIAILSRAQHPVVVVPGGGAFADKVRELQRALDFDDATAHRLAMLGMHQMAELFAGLSPRLTVTDSLDGISAALARGQVPVWVPLPMLEADSSIPSDWSITSDGIAARLAEILGGADLVLIKSVTPARTLSLQALADDGIVDEFVPTVVQRASLSWRILGPEDTAELARITGASLGGTA